MTVVLEVFEYISDAGFIGWPIIGLSMVLWSVLGYRWSLLRLPKGFDPEKLERLMPTANPGTLFESLVRDLSLLLENVSQTTRKEFQVVSAEYLQISATGTKLVNSIVAVAPLMGLLGTVAGMIVTFRSMESMALFSQGGGIAGGISQALITTQMGLAVAIPGVLIGRVLSSKQKSFEQTVEHFQSRLDKILDGSGSEVDL